MMQTLQSRPLDLNILPKQYQPRRITALMVAAALLVMAVLSGLIPAYDVFTAAQDRTADLETRLTQAQAMLAQTQSERAQLEGQSAKIERQIEQAHAEITHLRAAFSTLSRKHTPRWAGIAIAINALVPRVHIATIVQEEEVFILTGQASSQGLVLDYARALQATGRFANVRIISMVNADELGLIPDVEFSIQVEQ